MFRLEMNSEPIEISSIEGVESFLRYADTVHQFELWLSFDNGGSLSMLRNGEHAWLMYLPADDESGFTSWGSDTDGTVSYTLSNGQEDEYPRSWCIGTANCFKAVLEFYREKGRRPKEIVWLES